MLSDFETRLADVMGSRLAAPLAGAVDVEPGREVSRLVLGIKEVQNLEEDLLGKRPELVPGDLAPRRVLKLRCTIELDARLLAGEGRADQMQAIDGALYLLEDRDMQNGSAFLPADQSDPGFLIRSLTIVGSTPPQSITLAVEGFFWPRGVAGQTGPLIQQACIRSAVQPLLLDPAPATLAAGGPPTDFTLALEHSGTAAVATDGVNSLSYGSLLVSVRDAGDRPGQGQLSGGTAAAGGARVYPVTNGSVALSYTPPAQPALEFLVVHVENNAGGPSVELGRFPLRTRSV